MIRIAIVNNKKKEVDVLRCQLETYEQECQQRFQIIAFENGDQILNGYKQNYDVIIIHTEPQDMDGFELAGIIRRIDQRVSIIFQADTALQAHKGYEVDAADFMVRPITYAEFKHKMDRVLENRKEKAGRFMVLKIKGGLVKIEVSSIIYIESNGHQLTFHTTQGDYDCYGTMYKEAEKLMPQHFSFSRKGVLVNLEYVNQINNNTAILACHAQELPISGSQKKSFMEDFKDYVEKVV